MTDVLSGAIAAVKAGQHSFCKFISPNDAGATGAHQAGIYIPKNSIKLIFDTPGIKGQNKERLAELIWPDGDVVQCCFKYYGTSTRNEYRITRLGKTFDQDDLVIIVKKSENEYAGFVLFDVVEIELFLNEFGLAKEDTNSLIYFEGEDETMEETEGTVLSDETLPESTSSVSTDVNFKPKAHILTLLGEELIKDPVMAIYELVKNGYDADAESVDVYFNDISDLSKADIIVVDTGTGMTEDVLLNVWLEPGTAFRKPIENGVRKIVRTPIFKRVPMGEKGVGRFAVHKLGSMITLISRPSKVILTDDGEYIKKELLDYEINLEINWGDFTQNKYLSEIKVTYKKNTDPASFYFEDMPGTYIRISGLKEVWNRGMARQLKRHTISMVAPESMIAPQTDIQKFQVTTVLIYFRMQLS
jgi:hypothetical protein